MGLCQRGWCWTGCSSCGPLQVLPSRFTLAVDLHSLFYLSSVSLTVNVSLTICLSICLYARTYVVAFCLTLTCCSILSSIASAFPRCEQPTALIYIYIVELSLSLLTNFTLAIACTPLSLSSRLSLSLTLLSSLSFFSYLFNAARYRAIVSCLADLYGCR